MCGSEGKVCLNTGAPVGTGKSALRREGWPELMLQSGVQRQPGVRTPFSLGISVFPVLQLLA